MQLSKAVEALKKGNPPSDKGPKTSSNKPKSTAPQKSPTRSYSAIAGARPPNPSLVVDLAHLGIKLEDQVKPEILCDAINKGLATISPPQVKLVATRWTAKGNLVITGNHTATPHSLQLAAPHISTLLSKAIKLPSDIPISQPRPNVKWSKILLNGVPTGAFKNHPPFSPDRLHQELAANNPSYASLTITQKPSWVQPPSSYLPGTVSSLSVAFEDPDGSKLKMLLVERYLYTFGNRATIMKWKYHQKINKDKSKSNSAKHAQGEDTPGEEDTDTHLLSPAPPQTASAPPSQSRVPSRRSNRTAKPSRPLDA